MFKVSDLRTPGSALCLMIKILIKELHHRCMHELVISLSVWA